MPFDFAEPLLIVITISLMIGALFLILVPSIPVTALEWAIAMIFGAFTVFERLPLVAAVLITVMMILGISSGLWMPLFGLKGRKVSCMQLVAFFIGMIVGTPVPIVGSFIGGMLAVFLLEFVRTGKHDEAFQSSETAFWVVLASMFVEFLMAITVVLTTIISIILTA
ncbi:MAG: DUF456 family protein [Phototrophicaceae bacterium]